MPWGWGLRIVCVSKADCGVLRAGREQLRRCALRLLATGPTPNIEAPTLTPALGQLTRLAVAYAQAMVTSWRKLWAHDFPFGFVQLAGYAGSKQQSVAQLRRQQLAASVQEGVFFAVAMDLADPAVEADLNVTHPVLAHLLAHTVRNILRL